jgi:hypothetical protein
VLLGFTALMSSPQAAGVAEAAPTAPPEPIGA